MPYLMKKKKLLEQIEEGRFEEWKNVAKGLGINSYSENGSRIRIMFR